MANYLRNKKIISHRSLTLTETETALDGIEQHVAIGDNDDAHVNEENCENERPHVGDATQLENGPRGEAVPKTCT